MVSEVELAIQRLPRLYSKQAWSRPWWILIWQLVASYSERPSSEERADTRNFFIAMQKVLPCYYCRQHFLQHLNSPRFEKALESRTYLFMFFSHVINDISARNGRPVYTPMEQVRTVERLINWPDSWNMPGPNSEGSTQASSAQGNVPWYALVILGVIALAMGLGFGTLIPKGKQRINVKSLT